MSRLWLRRDTNSPVEWEALALFAEGVKVSAMMQVRRCRKYILLHFRKQVILLPEFLSALEGLMLQRRDAHPKETFLKWKDDEIAWGEFIDSIYAVAAGFWDAGIRTG